MGEYLLYFKKGMSKEVKNKGVLFRGCYKAILEEDTYQLQLSRYIHRNPLEAGFKESIPGVVMFII